jgi:hypothetical protein
MEDQERDMGPLKKGEEEIRRRSKTKERLTIMIFKKAGMVRTFKVSPQLILWASLFFLFYIVATIFLTNAYFDIYRANKTQVDKIAELRRELIKTAKSPERSKQHIALLDDYITKAKDKSPKPLSTVDYTESSLPKLVDIDELKVERNKSTINIEFRIVNRQVNEEPIGGYIFALASIRDSDKAEVWVYPSSPLKDGVPTNYRSGQRFFIQRFKSMSSKYTLGKSTNKPIILEILVYDRNGKLILKKVVEA